MREPFAISRSVQTDQPTILATLVDRAGHVGRGEACGVPYAGETPETMMAQIEEVRSQVEKGLTRDALLGILPAGGARCAIDGALWDLEAKQTGRSVYATAGVPSPKAVLSAFTIGIRSLADYEQTARAFSRFPVLKVKVDEVDPLSALAAVHRGAPMAQLIVDPNQSWSVTSLLDYASELSKLGVILVEQPIPVGHEADLDGVAYPISLAADELINDARDLHRAAGRFDVINIKLDKTGGLTEALRLAERATDAGFSLMVGCMAGSSLSMAPAHVLAQKCKYVDLDGPLLQSEDWPNGLVYDNGFVAPPNRDFWG
jgi:L-alanine-DL-glutamate epimerase-like enolase superfamily enzyme